MWQHLNFFQTFQVKHQNPWRCFTRQLKTDRFFIPNCSNKQSMIQCLKVDLKYLMWLERAPQKKYFCHILEWNLKKKWSEVEWHWKTINLNKFLLLLSLFTQQDSIFKNFPCCSPFLPNRLSARLLCHSAHGITCWIQIHLCLLALQQHFWVPTSLIISLQRFAYTCINSLKCSHEINSIVTNKISHWLLDYYYYYCCLNASQTCLS